MSTRFGRILAASACAAAIGLGAAAWAHGGHDLFAKAKTSIIAASPGSDGLLEVRMSFGVANPSPHDVTVSGVTVAAGVTGDIVDASGASVLPLFIPAGSDSFYDPSQATVVLRGVRANFIENKPGLLVVFDNNSGDRLKVFVSQN